jgi:hypothetical protein
MPGVAYMNPPVYTATDAFKYLEDLGSPQMMTYEGTLYSSSSGNTPSPYTGCANVLNAIENGQSCGILHPNTVLTQGENTLSTPTSPVINPLASAEYLNSNVSGYALIPYKYTYTLSQSWNNFVLISASNPQECNSIYSVPTTTQTQTEYSYSIISNSSNNFLSTIEGGATYLRFLNNKYYIANLSDYGTIISKNILFNMFTDRNFSNIYVNTTSLSNNGLYQTLLNASHSSNFTVNTYTQGSNPAFQTISSVPITPLFGNNALSELMSSIQSLNPLYGTNTGFFYVNNPAPSFINLFDWYKSRLYTNPLNLYLNMSSFTPSAPAESGISYNTKGYTRLVYVLNDKFNNTIYMPLDADIANITSINLAVTPVVNSINQNQTQLIISGNATYFNGVKLVPLVDNSIYLYYGADINYANYNPIQNPANAILCTYGTNSMYINPSSCVLSDPALTGASQNTNVITYAPSYNSSGVCNPPPNTLFSQPANNCNIYGNDNLPDTCNALSVNVQTADGTTSEQFQQWCVPNSEYTNGTGTCTSQIGLMQVVTTNSLGDFTFTANTCGIGQASIIATFYGYPYSEPITVNQPYLTSSAKLIYNYQGTEVNPQPSIASFQALNYSWSPNETLVTMQIGLAELSYGSITMPEVILLIAVAIGLVMFLKKR